MKAKILIITGLAIALIMAFCSQSNAQNKVGKAGDYSTQYAEGAIATRYDSTILLADETTLSYSKTEARIHCSNESVFNDLFKSHGTIFKRFSCTWKTDRHGRYKDYVIYLAKGDAETIVKWAKINL